MGALRQGLPTHHHHLTRSWVCSSVSGKGGVPPLPCSTKLSRGVLQQRGHVTQPVAALGGNGTSPLYQFRCSVGLVSGHGGVPPCPDSTRLSLGVSGSVAHARYAHTLRFYITPHFVKCSPAAALQLRLVSPTASRPLGFTKQALR